MLKKTEGTTKNGQSIDNDIGWKTQNGNKQKNYNDKQHEPYENLGMNSGAWEEYEHPDKKHAL